MRVYVCEKKNRIKYVRFKQLRMRVYLVWGEGIFGRVGWRFG